MNKVVFVALAFNLASNSLDSHAQSIERLETQKFKQTKTIEQQEGDVQISKFSQWGDNEILARYTNEAKTRRHLDVSLGFRYLMTNSFIRNDGKWDYAVAIAYQGEFDFFALTRNSSPVITTRHNPSFFYTRFRDPDEYRLSSWFVSIEHESNGQITDNLERLSAEIDAFENDYADDPSVSRSDIFEMAQQTISRSNNFLGLGINYRLSDPSNTCDAIFKCSYLHVKLRHQLDDTPEDEIWWRADEQGRLKEHVGTNIDLETTFNAYNVPQSLRLTYRTGQVFGGSPFNKSTFDLRYYIDIPVGRYISSMFNYKRSEAFSIPLVVRYHHGYIDELYNYSQKIDYLAVGLHAKY